MRLPQGKGWVSQEMVVKRWKVYKRLLFPCGVFTDASPTINAILRILILCKDICNELIFTEIMNC